MARSAGGLALHARELAAVAEEISLGYMDVLHKRPVAGTYSHHSSGVSNGRARGVIIRRALYVRPFEKL